MYAAELIQDDLSQVVAVPSPAAGAGFTYTYPGSEFWRPRLLCFQLVNSGTAGNRLVSLDFLNGDASVMARYSAGYTQAASLTTVYTFALGANVYGANDAAAIGCPLGEAWLRKGCAVKVNVGTVKSGDQISAIRLTLDQVYAGSYPDEG